MSRLLDRLLREPWLAARIGDPDLPIVDATSVSEVYAESPNMGTEQTTWPNVAPPFPEFWMEFRAPRQVTLAPGKTRPWGPPWPRAWGILVRTKGQDFLDALPPSPETDRLKGARWVYEATLFIEMEPGQYGQESSKVYAVDSEGQEIDAFLRMAPDVVRAFQDESPAVSVWLTDAAGQAIPWQEGLRAYQALEANRSAICYDCGQLAISFMHCRNVRLERQDPPEKVNKKAERRYGRPLVTYHTIVVDPMRQVLRSEGRAGEAGLARALHVCRGHFRQYASDRPMFGQPGRHGTFWVEQHVRGARDKGTHLTDYRIRAPR